MTPHLPSGVGLRMGGQQWEPQGREGALPFCGPLAPPSPHFLSLEIQVPLPSDSVPSSPFYSVPVALSTCPSLFLCFPLQQNWS